MIAVFKRFFAFSSERKALWYRAFALEVLRTVAEALQFLPLAFILMNLVEGSLAPWMALAAFAAVAASVALQAVCKFLSHRLEITAGYRMSSDNRLGIGDKLRYVPMGFFKEESLGELTAVCTSTMDDLEAMSSSVIIRVMTGFTSACVFSLAFVLVDWRIALTYLCGVAATLAVNHLLIASARRHAPARLSAQTRLVGSVLEYIQGMEVVKAFGTHGAARRAIDAAIAHAEDQNFVVERKNTPFVVAQQVILRLFSVLAVVVSVLLYLAGSLDLFFCLMTVVGGFLVYSQVEAAVALVSMLTMIDVSIERIAKVQDAPELPVAGEGFIAMAPPDAHSPAIELEHVSFAYGSTEVLHDVSLSIPARSTCAIVGPSGSGKTTLVNLMARYWDVGSGSAKVAGKDVRAWDFDELMGQFAMVFQDVYLFNDTIEANIRFGAPDATDEEVREAARQACCDGFINALPDGYRTVVGEGGATLSGGEKQRISIARALLKNAPIVLLDEATANVDPENEAELARATRALSENCTVVMIAHKLSTVRSADQIVVLDEGRISQRGTHEQLAAKPGIYHDFVSQRERAVQWRLGAKGGGWGVG